MLTKLTNLVKSITELPNAIHACVEMAREANTMREELDRANEALSKHNDRFVDNLEYISRIASNAEAEAQLERFISDERWAWARERIEALTNEANDLARAAEQERRELAREREARRWRKLEPNDGVPPLTMVLFRIPTGGAMRDCRSTLRMHLSCDTYPGCEWRYLSPEDMP